MNTSALKSFAPAVRRDLIEAVGRKLQVVLAAQTPDYRTTFAPQVAALRELARVDRTGLVEKVAYTWFNRFTALRYLDARGWHPFRARVLTAADEGSTQPELLKLARDGMLPEELKRHTDPVRLNGLLDDKIPSSNPQGEVYRHLVLASCRFYHALLPDVFERLDDATELLLPDDLLTEHSVVQGFRTEITDADCADVEIIGWLYQFYVAERKEEIMALKEAVSTEDIPARTQLFTPHWIVRYLVENSVGRLWLLNRPASRLREHMPYYIEGEPETDFLKIAKPEEIRACDPAVGSGHMLTYAFDLLHLIYEEEGYAASEIPALILRHNLVGIDIDARAAQLAELALIFKAREKARRFFQPEHRVRPNVVELRDVRFAEGELREYIRALDLGPLFNAPLIELLHQFEEAKNFGSLIRPCLDERAIAFTRRAIEAADLAGQLFLSETHVKILRVLDQAEALSSRYHVGIANPPYLGSAAFNESLKEFAETNFTDGRTDLFALFIARTAQLCVPGGFVSMITMQSWLFLASYEDLRRQALSTWRFTSLVHFGARAFDSISGEIVQTAAFVLQNRRSVEGHGVFFRLLGGRNEAEKDAALRNATGTEHSPLRFRVSADDLLRIPGCPIAYWIGVGVLRAFSHGRALEDIAPVRQGFQTGDNGRFMRQWPEVSFDRCKLDAKSKEDVFSTLRKWVPYNKGGTFRRWYGNNEYLVAFDEQNYAILARSGNCLPSRHLYFKKAITWSALASGAFGARLSPEGFTFSAKGACAFPNGAYFDLALGLLNSAVAEKVFEFFAATLDFNVGSIRKLPVLPDGAYDTSAIASIVSASIELARRDWDNFETSWDFRGHPLLRPGLKGATLEASWRNWDAQSTAAIRRMQHLETENNRLFIAAYGLDGELQPDVPVEQITLAHAEGRRDVAAFLSYAVGCMLGRYSPDHPGLILANTGDTLRDFLDTVGRPQDQLTFVPDEDGIIPVLDGEWFEDDIVARTREFLRATCGDATLRENLRFIEDSLGKDLRKYFLTDFYKDHLQTYKKRPIYWMVQSPKKGFSALVYLHRYTRDTLNVVLNRYLREYVVRLRSRQAQLAQSLAGDALSAAERNASRKESERIVKVLHECEDWEREALLPLAQQRVELDLDDGVKVNYLKLADVLAPIPGLAAAEE